MISHQKNQIILKQFLKIFHHFFLFCTNLLQTSNKYYLCKSILAFHFLDFLKVLHIFLSKNDFQNHQLLQFRYLQANT